MAPPSWLSPRASLLTLGVLLALAGLAGCAGNGPFGGMLRRPSPHESYLDTLRRAGLHETALGRDWTRAGERALQTAVTATLPFRETGYLPPDAPSAAAYRMDLQRGRRLVVDVTFDSVQPGRLFVDLFEVAADGSTRRVASLDANDTTLTHEVRRDTTYVLRVQPELLRGGRFTLVQRTVSSLVFPIPGLTARAIQSGFGAARDGGARGHEGVDIFASRGTPVVAVADGLAQMSTNTLGGNVVWLHDRSGGRTFYYAHLDGWAIEGSTRVRAGDILGYVGNTGNARTTAPHLHFGIYVRGAIDPAPFLRPDDPDPPPPAVSPDRLRELVRVTPLRTAVRESATPNTPVRVHLVRGSVARVAGVSGRALRVVLPDDSVGYVDASAVTAADTPLRRDRLAAGARLRERPLAMAPVVDVLAADTRVDVLGRFGTFEFVRVPDGTAGWVGTTDAAGE
jgi:peptidoglycan LD-endopeptidase LytH